MANNTQAEGNADIAKHSSPLSLDIHAQLLAMKQELLSISFGCTTRGTQPHRSPERRHSPVQPGEGEFAQVSRMGSPPSDAHNMCHYKRVVGHTLHESAVSAVVTAVGVNLVQDQQASKMREKANGARSASSSAGQLLVTRRSRTDSCINTDDSAERPAPLSDHFLRRNASASIQTTQHPDCEPVRTLRDCQPPTLQHHYAIQPTPPITQSFSDGLFTTDDPAERPAPFRHDSLRRSKSVPIKRVRFNDKVQVKHISPKKRVESGILTLRPTPNACGLSGRQGVSALCSLNSSSLTVTVESSKGTGFDKMMANVPIGDLVATLFPDRVDMFRLSCTKGGQDDHVYCCNPAHDDTTCDNPSWMLEWLLVFQRTGVAIEDRL